MTAKVRPLSPMAGVTRHRVKPMHTHEWASHMAGATRKLWLVENISFSVYFNSHNICFTDTVSEQQSRRNAQISNECCMFVRCGSSLCGGCHSQVRVRRPSEACRSLVAGVTCHDLHLTRSCVRASLVAGDTCKLWFVEEGAHF